MTTLKIDTNSTFDLDITLRESDKYSGLAFLQFEKNYGEGQSHGSSQMFLTPEQLDTIGRFLIDQASKIQAEQEIRARHQPIL